MKHLVQQESKKFLKARSHEIKGKRRLKTTLNLLLMKEKKHLPMYVPLTKKSEVNFSTTGTHFMKTQGYKSHN